MNTISYKERMQTFYMTTNIPITVTNSSGEILHSIGIKKDVGHIKAIDFNLLKQKKYLNHILPNEVMFLCLHLERSSSSINVLLGPLSYKQTTTNIPFIQSGSTVHYYKLIESLFDANTKFFSNNKLLDSVLEEIELNLLEYREIDFYHHNYRNEQAMISHIFNEKDDNTFKKGLDAIKQLSGYVSETDLRQLKNMHIASISLFTRKTIELGLDPHTAMTISDSLIRKIEASDKIADLDIAMFHSYNTFYSALTKSKKGNHSKKIMDFISIIEKNLSKKITLSGIAEYLNCNSSYLSRLIKKELDTTFTDYLLNKRILEAKRLLRYTKYTVSEISSIVGFTSVSYFIQSFKNTTGNTPSQYRSK